VHLEPWYSPEAISRVWCLFEIFTTLQVGGQVTVCLATKDRRNFAATKASGDGKHEELLQRTIDTIDARKAAATYPPDWNLIVKLILDAGKLDQLNEAVQSQMRCWLESDTGFAAEAWTRQGQQSQMREFAGLIRDYRDRVYWFELVDWLRKAVLCGGLIFFERGSLAQLSAGTVLSMGFLCVQLVLQPYKQQWHNVLKAAVELFIALTFLFSFQIRAEGPGRDFMVIDYLLVGQVAIIALAMPLALLRWLVFAPKRAWRSRKQRLSVGFEYLGNELLQTAQDTSDASSGGGGAAVPSAVLRGVTLLAVVSVTVLGTQCGSQLTNAADCATLLDLQAAAPS